MARNDREFKGKSLPPADMVKQALKHLHEYQSNQNDKAAKNPIESVKNRHDICWSLPPKDALKLNVDAHSLSDGRWALGLILRGDDESCVRAATRIRKGTDCATLAEAMGLEEALKMVKRWDLRNTIIETDAKVIVDTVNSRNRPRTIWGKVVERCAKMIKDMQGVNVIWVRRSGNRAAHELARWAVYEPNKDWTSNYPLCIKQHIQKDMDSAILN
jgi:ribonuclease HI